MEEENRGITEGQGVKMSCRVDDINGSKNIRKRDYKLRQKICNKYVRVFCNKNSRLTDKVNC